MKKVLSFLMIGVPLAISSCRPSGPEFVEELDVVVTNYDPQFNFSAVKTYVLLDTIVHIQDRSNAGSNVLLRRDLDPFIIAQVQLNLNQLVYKPLTDFAGAQKPDVVVQLSALSTTNVGAYSRYTDWWDYWGWYPGWSRFSPYMGGGWYPYPIRTTSYYTYETGTLRVDMADPNSPDPANKRVPIVWTAAFQGILTGNSASLQSRLGPGINKAFQQSPYP
jgi:hypothetical protein